MKARTSGAGRTGCEAVQYSDQMQCARCGLAYDVNDPDPPDCQRPAPRAETPAKPDAEGLAEAHRRCVESLEKMFS